MFQSLFNEGDSDFFIDFADRAECHCHNDGVLTTTQTIPRLQELQNQTALSIIADAARWTSNSSVLATRNAEFNQVVNSYLPQKPGILINQFKNIGLYPDIDSPVFSQNGGTIVNGYNLTLSNPNVNGNIYYTLDGTDPRLEGGGLSPAAQLYSGAISLTGIKEVKTRIYYPCGTYEWSAMCPKVFYGPQDYDDLVINEIHFNPEKEVGGNFVYDSKLYEFVEIYNKGTSTIDLANIAFAYGMIFLLGLR